MRQQRYTDEKNDFFILGSGYTQTINLDANMFN